MTIAGVPNYMMQANQFGNQRGARPQGNARPPHQFQSGGQRGPQTRTPQGAMGVGQPAMRAPQGKPNVGGAPVNAYYGQMSAGAQQQQRAMGQHMMPGAPIEQEALSTKLASAPPQVCVLLITIS